MSDEMYCNSTPALAGQRVGPQMRHIIEFYEAFLNGIGRRSIDYDARRRDPVVEASRLAAIARLRIIQTRLRSIKVMGDCAIWVRLEDSPGGAYVMSSVARELQSLSQNRSSFCPDRNRCEDAWRGGGP